MSKSKIRAIDDLRTRFRPTCDDITLERGLEAHSLGVSRDGDNLVNVSRNPAFKRDKGVVARPYLNTSARKSRRPECGAPPPPPPPPPPPAQDITVVYNYEMAELNQTEKKWKTVNDTRTHPISIAGTEISSILISSGANSNTNYALKYADIRILRLIDQDGFARLPTLKAYLQNDTERTTSPDWKYLGYEDSGNAAIWNAPNGYNGSNTLVKWRAPGELSDTTAHSYPAIMRIMGNGIESSDPLIHQGIYLEVRFDFPAVKPKDPNDLSQGYIWD